MDQKSERDCGVTQRPEGCCPPQSWKSKERGCRDKGLPPTRDWRGKGDKVFPGDQEVASTPNASWSLLEISVAGLNRTPWEQPGLPSPTSNGHSSQDRQKDKHRVESHR